MTANWLTCGDVLNAVKEQLASFAAALAQAAAPAAHLLPDITASAAQLPDITVPAVHLPNVTRHNPANLTLPQATFQSCNKAVRSTNAMHDSTIDG